MGCQIIRRYRQVPNQGKKVPVVLVPICIAFVSFNLVVSFESTCVNRVFGMVYQTVDSLFLQLGEWCPNGCPLSSARR